MTTVAAWQKIFSADLGFFAAADQLADQLATGALAADRAAVAPTLIFNQRLDGWLTALFLILMWFVIAEMLRVAWRHTAGKAVPASSEVPYVATRLDVAAAPGAN